MEDVTGFILKKINNRETKEKLLIFIIKEKWSQIVGAVAANHTQPFKLDDHTMFIHTDNAAWSHNLLMLKRQVLSKMQEYIPAEPGKKRAYKVKDLRFYNGRIEEERILVKDETPFIPKLDPEKRCPLCGVMLIPGEKICGSCERQEKAKERKKIHKILCDAPWFGYKDCVNYLKCDKIDFMGVKADMQERAKEKALDPNATREEQYFALMLVYGKQPEDMNEEMLEKSLKSWKRSREYVSTPRKQLSGKKR